jgi:hypothetical protein
MIMTKFVLIAALGAIAGVSAAGSGPKPVVNLGLAGTLACPNHAIQITDHNKLQQQQQNKHITTTSCDLEHPLGRHLRHPLQGRHLDRAPWLCLGLLFVFLSC